VAFALTGLGEVALAEGDSVRATPLLDQALASFHARRDDHRLARVYALRAQVALERHNDASAMDLIAHSLQLAQAVGDPAITSAAMAFFADGAARCGDAGWAARLWGAAEALACRQLRVPAASASRQRLIASARFALGEPAFTAAWTAGRGLSPESAIAARGVTTAPAAAPRSAELTKREFEALHLLAEGLTNAQIAERLVLSLSTVKTYLSVIYGKLGVTSRTAAMRYVIDHGL
jgi:ATP/maltotriose-dependent transcriptional regulator MalT